MNDQITQKVVMDYQATQKIMRELMAQQRHDVPTDDEIEKRIIGYLKTYRDITKSRSEHADLTFILERLGALERA